MTTFELDISAAGLLLIDVQDSLFPLVNKHQEVQAQMLKILKGINYLDCPIVITEQYPKGLGSTLKPLLSECGPSPKIMEKTTFSCMKDNNIKNFIMTHSVSQWIVIGIETHVCILQSVKDLLMLNREIAVVANATSSRSSTDYMIALDEMKNYGARITSVETVLFELLKDSKHPKFKFISQLIRT